MYLNRSSLSHASNIPPSVTIWNYLLVSCDFYSWTFKTRAIYETACFCCWPIRLNKHLTLQLNKTSNCFAKPKTIARSFVLGKWEKGKSFWDRFSNFTEEPFSVKGNERLWVNKEPCDSITEDGIGMTLYPLKVFSGHSL